MNLNPAAPRSREITGRTVLVCFVAFFALIAAVNAVMIRFAVTTFAGTETDSAYRAGLAYNGEEAAANMQDALRWTVDGTFARGASGEAVTSGMTCGAGAAIVSGAATGAAVAGGIAAAADGAAATGARPAPVGTADEPVAPS